MKNIDHCKYADNIEPAPCDRFMISWLPRNLWYDQMKVGLDTLYGTNEFKANETSVAARLFMILFSSNESITGKGFELVFNYSPIV